MAIENDGNVGPGHALINANPLNFSWCLDGQVAGSARPGRYGNLLGDLARLKEEGIKVIVNLCAEPLAVPAEFDGCFTQVHEPVQDGEAPTFSQLDRIIARVRQDLAQQRRIVVHCQGGVGRTATVLIPLLIALDNASLDDAVNRLRAAGRHVQTMHQWEFVQEWTEKNRM